MFDSDVIGMYRVLVLCCVVAVELCHSDPKLALQIYTKITTEQRRRGPGARLVGVFNGARWTEADSHAEPTADDPAQVAVG